MLIKWLKKLHKRLECYGDVNIYLTQIYTLKTMYNAFVFLHVDYFALIWNKLNCSKTFLILSDLNFLGTP